MLGNTPFYWATTRKIVAGFGTIFNDMQVVRDNKTINVPIAYAPRTKYLSRINEDYAKDGVQFMTTLPRMSFNLDGLAFDPTRLKNPNRKIRNTSSAQSLPNPVPYTYNMSLSIWAGNLEDGLQILEQILPKFAPDINITIIDIDIASPEFKITNDVPIVLTGVDMSDNYEGDLLGDRGLEWNLTFELQGYMYPDIKDASIIRKSSVVFKDTSDASWNKILETLTKTVNPLTAFETDLYSIDSALLPGD